MNNPLSLQSGFGSWLCKIQKCNLINIGHKYISHNYRHIKLIEQGFLGYTFC